MRVSPREQTLDHKKKESRFFSFGIGFNKGLSNKAGQALILINVAIRGNLFGKLLRAELHCNTIDNTIDFFRV